jgi:hypothetical protein
MLRPSLRPSTSSPNTSATAVPMAKSDSNDNGKLSVQFSERPSLTSAMSSSGVGFPRTSTKDSTDTGRYRRKVGFEAFEAGPEALFAYTCQVTEQAELGG